MRTYTLVGNRIYTDQEVGEIRLEYYLVEETRDVSNYLPLYGIRIIKYSRSESGLIREQRTASAISYSRIFVMEVLNKLIDHLVTPISMLEIIDDQVTQEMYLAIPEIG